MSGLFLSPAKDRRGTGERTPCGRVEGIPNGMGKSASSGLRAAFLLLLSGSEIVLVRFLESVSSPPGCLV